MDHPYIETSKICGGSPVIKGTRTRVVDIAIESIDRIGVKTAYGKTNLCVDAC